MNKNDYCDYVLLLLFLSCFGFFVLCFVLVCLFFSFFPPVFLFPLLELILCVRRLRHTRNDSWSLSHLGYLYPGTTPVMIKLDHNRSCPWV